MRSKKLDHARNSCFGCFGYHPKMPMDGFFASQPKQPKQLFLSLDLFFFRVISTKKA